jgi:hypothetical protein
MLGDALREADRAADILDDRLCDAIRAFGVAPGAFAREAVVAFERHATEEEWTSLLSALRKVEHPGAACLDAMVRWHLGRVAQQDDRGAP